jgi:glycosyltransferase involved in cell wall biosynthesis
MISIIIPVYNEESLIDPLYERVRSAILKFTEDFEVLFVDDGSADHTPQRLEACHLKDPRFKVLSLSRNFGHQAAFTAGLSYAKGDLVAMMDGDLQDPPELIQEMYEKLTVGNLDVVYARRSNRQEKFRKRFYINLFHYIFKRLSQLEHMHEVGNFSLMNRKALDAILVMQEKNRYLPGLRAFIGFNQGQITYDRPDRKNGEAKMGIGRLVSLALDAIFSFSSLPVKICLYSGIVGIILIFFAFIYIIIGKITGVAPFGWSSIILSIYFIGSVQLLSIGILGEYVYRIYKETQNRPVFFVRKFIE